LIYDLIIIGGGPGGATAAKIAAESGANVLICEAAEEGRYKCCAGGIPISNEEFTPIPRDVGEREIIGGVLVTPQSGPKEVDATREGDKGYCMFRTDFDKYLLDIARDAGAEVMYKLPIKHIEVNSNREVIVKGPQEFRSRCLILATGLGGAKLQRQVGIEVPPMIGAIQAEFDLPESAVNEHFGDRVWEFFDRSIVHNGVAWAFPKQDAVSIGVLGEGVKMSNFNTFLQYPLLKEKLKGRDMKVFGGRKVWAAPIPDKIIAKPYCERVMVIGDACGTADPILYEGIHQARLSGKLAADVFCKALNADDFGEVSLASYHQLLLNQLYEEDLRYAYKFHHLLYHSGMMEELINATYSIALEDPEMMQTATALFSRSQTRKQSWEIMMSRKWKLVKKLGIWKSLRLFPTLIRANRI